MASYQKYKTKSGERWLLKMYVGKNPQTGEPIRITRRGFLKKSEAVAAVERILKENKMDSYANNKDLTYQDVFNEWWEGQSQTLKPSTIKAKSNKFSKWILPYFSQLKIAEINKKYFQDFVNKMANSMPSFKDYVIQARLVFKYALQEGYITHDPTEYIIYPALDKHIAEDNEAFEGVWTREETTKFLTNAKEFCDLRNYAMFHTLVWTGLRKGELLALQDQDIMKESKELHVRRTLYWENGEYILLTPKTKNARRKIKLDDETFELLTRLMRVNREIRFSLGRQNEQQKFLFIRDELQPLRLGYPNETLRSLCKRFGVKDIKVHGLRHTYASLLFASGAQLKEVQIQLGHARLETTANIYTHILEETQQSVTERLSDFMKEKSNVKTF
ncbi:tyrosine-type recombinase/integrase [Lysinibacillus sp. NPDC047702]|uniref:tyrosine-type recombinase/integrase n=1 Tax=unclassified Lysinibacillus TaxID=2636778 RepID=UPI003D007527